MKCALSILTCFLLLNGIAQRNPANDYRKIPPADLKVAVQKINECNCIIDDIPSPILAEDSIMIGYAMAFKGSDFKTLDGLFEGNSSAVKIYAWLMIENYFKSQVTRRHLKILKSKDSIHFYKGGTMRISEFSDLENLYPSRSEIRLARKKPKFEAKLKKEVIAFIKTYAKFPESYQPQKFSEFQIYEPDDPVSPHKIYNYIICHTYSIKDSAGNLVTQTSVFRLISHSKWVIADMDMDDEDIYSQFLSYYYDDPQFINCDPVFLENWLKEFGKELTAKDKKALRLDKIPPN